MAQPGWVDANLLVNLVVPDSVTRNRDGTQVSQGPQLFLSSLSLSLSLSLSFLPVNLFETLVLWMGRSGPTWATAPCRYWGWRLLRLQLVGELDHPRPSDPLSLLYNEPPSNRPVLQLVGELDHPRPGDLVVTRKLSRLSLFS